MTQLPAGNALKSDYHGNTLKTMDEQRQRLTKQFKDIPTHEKKCTKSMVDIKAAATTSHWIVPYY